MNPNGKFSGQNRTATGALDGRSTAEIIDVGVSIYQCPVNSVHLKGTFDLGGLGGKKGLSLCLEGKTVAKSEGFWGGGNSTWGEVGKGGLIRILSPNNNG